MPQPSPPVVETSAVRTTRKLIFSGVFSAMLLIPLGVLFIDGDRPVGRGDAETFPTRLPPLYDRTLWPTRRQSCGHCPGPADGFPCCGVCNFDWPCKVHHPDKTLPDWLGALPAATRRKLHAFKPCKLFARLRGRTTWFIGDSQMHRMYGDVECFLHQYAPSLQRTGLPGLSGASAQDTAERLAPLEPVCLKLKRRTALCLIRATKGRDQLHILRTLLMRSPGFENDLVVMNFGLHYHNREHEYHEELQQLAAWRSLMAARGAALPTILWMETPPQHFPSRSGDYGNVSAPGCAPLNASDPTVAAGGRFNEVASMYTPLIADGNVEIYHASAPFWDVHVEGRLNDCTHWCSPTVYPLWVLQLQAALAAVKLNHGPAKLAAECTFGRTAERRAAAAAAAR